MIKYYGPKLFNVWEVKNFSGSCQGGRMLPFPKDTVLLYSDLALGSAEGSLPCRW